MADLVLHREKFLVPSNGGAEIRVSFTEEDTATGKVEYDAWYECVTCESALIWKKAMRVWECPQCGYNLTAAESSDLCDRHINIVRQLQSLSGRSIKKRGWLWRLFLFWKKDR